MTDEKRLREELNDLLRQLRKFEQESEEKRKAAEETEAQYLEAVYSGERSGYYFAAELLETVLICNNIKGKED